MDVNYVEVLPNIWLTDCKIIRNISFLEDKGIKLIINCSKNIPFNDKYKCKKIRIPVNDDLQLIEIENLYSYFDKITAIIYQYFCQLKPVIVHCYAGKQRSASIIVAFILRYTKLNLMDAIFFLRLKKKNVFTPCINFKKALEKYEINAT